MKRIYLVFVFFAFSLSFLEAQNSSIDFDNLNIKWSHESIDLSYANSQSNLNGKNHLFYFIPNSVLLDNDFAYTILLNLHGFESGFLLQKHNINNGELIWQTTFDLRNDPHHLAISDMYFNEEGNLEILSFRRSDAISFLGWHEGTIARNIYNKTNGNLINYTFADPISSNVQRLKKLGTAIKFINYNGEFIYYFTGALLNNTTENGCNTYTIDSLGTKLKENFISFNQEYNDYRYSYSLNYSDTITTLNVFNKQDSIQYFTLINKYDNNWNILSNKLLDLPYTRPNQIYINKVYEDFIELIAEFGTSDGNEYKIIYVDKADNRIISVMEIPASRMYSGYSSIRLRDKSATLFFKSSIKSVNGDIGCYLQIYKFDGIETTLLKESKILNSKKYTVNYVKELQNGDLLITGSMSSIKANGEILQNTNSSQIICIDKNELLLTSVKNNYKNTSFNISPNPSSSFIEIKTDADFDEVIIFNLEGKIVKCIKSKDTQIDISSLADATYICEIKKNGKVVGSGGRFVKVE